MSTRGRLKRDLLAGSRDRLPQAREEPAQQRRAFAREQAGDDLDPVVEPGVLEQVVKRPDRAGLGIVAAEIKPPNAGIHDRARAHGARLHGDIELRLGETPAAERGRRAPEREDLRVRRRVAAGLALVVGERDHLVADHDDGAHRHLAASARGLGRPERLPHEPELPLPGGAGRDRERNRGGGAHGEGLFYYHLVPKPDIDLSFRGYVAARKSDASTRSREGAGYAYSGDIKVRSALDRIRPVTLAVEATVRLWQSMEKARMLGTAVKVTGKQFPRIAKLAERCAETLRIPLPTVYVSPNIGSLNAHTFGTADDPYIVINAALIDHLSELELLDVIGHECGHIQNNHVVYLTTLHFLSHAANLFLRWSVRPAVLALNGWARRAEITCDRAGLICTGDLDTSIGCLVKLALGSRKLYSDVNIDEYLAQLEEVGRGVGRLDELTRTHPYLPKRVAALRLFAETAYFKGLKGDPRHEGNGVTDGAPGAPGTSKDACDARVAELLSVLR
jgi:Zn-dependent protease with chaperone function